MNGPTGAGFATYPSLEQRTAFVSGGASGLGAEFVTQLAGQGARVAFVDIDVDRGTGAGAGRCGTAGADAFFQECDVRNVRGSAGVHCSGGRAARRDPGPGQQRRQRPSGQGRGDGRQRCGTTASPSTCATTSSPPRPSRR